MTYEELVDFLEKKMSMSHVYQPLLVRALVDAGGVATVRQLGDFSPLETIAYSSATITSELAEKSAINCLHRKRFLFSL